MGKLAGESSRARHSPIDLKSMLLAALQPLALTLHTRPSALVPAVARATRSLATAMVAGPADDAENCYLFETDLRCSVNASCIRARSFYEAVIGLIRGRPGCARRKLH